MNDSNDGDPKPIADAETRSLSDDEQRFLSYLLDELAEHDRAAHDALLKANPDWAEHYGESGDLRERIRAVLTGQAGIPMSPAQERLIERTKASWDRCRADSGRSASGAAPDEPTGILTSVTRQVPPERALELYRKITPGFVYQVLSRLNESASLRAVQQVVEHLCGEEVQARLRACRHVRDGIIDELRTVLSRSEIRQEMSRDDLQHLLEESGAMSDLVAMENCIKLAATKVG